MRRRLFVAADLDDAARNGCAGVAARLRAKGWDGRFIAPENYHLTVAFLGNVDDERIGDVRAALRAVAPTIPGVVMALDSVGAFPDRSAPRVAWVGPAQPVPAFGTLCGVVRSALSAQGFSFDPHAEPHVTLARGDGRNPLPSVAPPQVEPLRIDALTLYESHTEPAGARYEALERLVLAGPGTIVR